MNSRGAIQALPHPQPIEGDRSGEGRIRAGGLELDAREPVAFPG